MGDGHWRGSRRPSRRLADRPGRLELVGELRAPTPRDAALGIEDAEHELYDRPDPEREQDRPEADRAAHEEAGHENDQLDPRPGAPDRPPEAVVEPGHEAVARTGAEVEDLVVRDADRLELEDRRAA